MRHLTLEELVVVVQKRNNGEVKVDEKVLQIIVPLADIIFQLESSLEWYDAELAAARQQIETDKAIKEIDELTDEVKEENDAKIEAVE